MEEELWKDVSDFPNYQVSTFGSIKNITDQKLLNMTIKGGYCLVYLKNNKIQKSFRVHRLVAMAFIENPENKPEVNHKDKDKTNNNVSNLEWNTRTENVIHSKENSIITTNRNKAIFRIDKDTDEILEKYDSIELAGSWAFHNQLTKTIHNGRNSIGNCIQGRSGSAYGFKWSLENKNEDLEGEIWKEVIIDKVHAEKFDASKKHFVSSLGRFKNFYGVVMENYKVNESGYIRVFLHYKTFFLHRLVALAFLPNPEGKKQVNHKDGNKLNNTLENLEWCTNQENQIHKVQIGLGNNFKRKIIQYDIHMNEIKRFDSIVSASEILNIGKTNIFGVLTNHRKTVGGFIFKYLDE
jgi:hypothetical protein